MHILPTEWVRHYWKLLRLLLAVLLLALVAVACIELLALATGSTLPDGWMLSTGPLP